MREIFEELIAAQIAPVLEKITEAVEEIEDLHRRLENMTALGVVDEVNPITYRVRVKHGKKKTPFIPAMTIAAGNVRDYRCPSEGEQCLLINYANGDNSSQCVALMGIFSVSNPPPGMNPDRHITVYPNGSKVTMDHGANKLTISHVGDAVFEATETMIIRAKNLVLGIGEGGFFHRDFYGYADRITHTGGSNYETETWHMGGIVVGIPDYGLTQPKAYDEV